MRQHFCYTTEGNAFTRTALCMSVFFRIHWEESQSLRQRKSPPYCGRLCKMFPKILGVFVEVHIYHTRKINFFSFIKMSYFTTKLHCFIYIFLYKILFFTYTHTLQFHVLLLRLAFSFGIFRLEFFVQISFFLLNFLIYLLWNNN